MKKLRDFRRWGKFWLCVLMLWGCGGSAAPIWVGSADPSASAMSSPSEEDAQAMTASPQDVPSPVGNDAGPFETASPQTIPMPTLRDAGASETSKSTPPAIPTSSPQSGTVVVDCVLPSGQEYECTHSNVLGENVVTTPGITISFALVAGGSIQNDAWCGAGDAGTWTNPCPSGAACAVAGLPFGTNPMGTCR